MPRYHIKDLKKVSKTETICLKNTPKKVKDSVSLSAMDKTKVNLKSFERSHKKVWTLKPDRNMDGIHFKNKKNNFHLVPKEKILNPPGNRLGSTVRIAVSGLIIMLLINFVNVFGNGSDFKNILVSRASTGLNNLMAGVNEGKTMGMTRAEEEFVKAEKQFNSALEEISFLKTSTAFADDQNLKSLEYLLQAGKNISEAGKLFSGSAQNLQTWPDLFVQTNRNIVLNNSTEQTEASPSNKSLTDILAIDLQNVELAIQKISEANDNLNKVNATFLPAEYREALPQIKENLNKLNAFLNNISSHFPAILELLGDRYPHRYLILLQNDTESRPTGGFIGSIMIVDINDGVVTKADFHDVYKYDGQLNEHIDAPEDIEQITSEWRLRDSNYSPDFAISAEKAAWFLQKSKGPSVDSVIAINQSAIGDLVAEMGPIEVEGLNYPIDSNNFQFILGYLIESKQFGENNPKEILTHTIRAFRKKIIEHNNPQSLLALLSYEIRDQKIMFYSRDKEVQALFEELRLTPHQAVLEEGEDYMQVVATSIGGNKSDLYMTQTLHHNTIIDPVGEIIDELSITRSHHWETGEIARWNNILNKFGFGAMPEHLISILGNSTNKSSVKVYVPLGSELQNTVGIDADSVITRHDSELQKTYFLFQMSVEPGREQSISLRYKIPTTLNLYSADMYRFTAEKQLTIVPTELKKDLTVSPGLSILKNNQKGISLPEKLRDEYKLRAVIAR